MRKLLLITFILLINQAFAQDVKPINTFIGIEFGASYVDVAALLKARGGKVMTESFEKKDMLAYQDIMFGNQKADVTAVRFINDKAYQAIFFFKIPENSTVAELNAIVVKGLEKVYGKGHAIKEFTAPYQEGDGKETEALNTGYAEFKTFWYDGTKGISESAHKGEVAILIFDSSYAKSKE